MWRILNCADYEKRSPLNAAVLEQKVEVVSKLINQGANVNQQCTDVSSTYYTPLHFAIQTQNKDILRLLLDAGANVYNNVADSSKECYSCSFNKMNLFCQSLPIYMAIQTGNLDIMKLFIDAIPDINAKDPIKGLPLIHAAVMWGNSSIVKLLLNAGADLNAEDEEGNTPLHVAASVMNLNTLKLLIDSGANVNATNILGETPLFGAAEFANVDTVKLLLEYGADVNAECNAGENPLRVAGLDLDILKVLIKAGADVNLCNNRGDTAFLTLPDHLPVLTPITSEHKCAVRKAQRLLIDYVDVNITDKDGKNILAYPLLRGFLNNYKIILEHTAKLNLLDYQIDLSLLDAISSTSNYRQYFEDCTQELKRAKSTRLQNCWVTFFDLLVVDDHELVKFAGNKNLLKDFEETNLEYIFPIYGSEMQDNISKGIDGRKLFDGAAKSMSFYLPIFDPFHLVIRDVLYALNGDDWEKLCGRKRRRE